MPIPIHVVGLALASKKVLSKKNIRTPTPVKKRIARVRPQLTVARRPRPTGPNFLQKLMGNFSSTLSKVIQKPPKEDYDTIIKSFVPQNAKLLTPKYPVNSTNIQFADLDGDSQDEMIASYLLDNEITTLILKKQGDTWIKSSEIINSEYDTLHYVGFADIMSKGKKQLLFSCKQQNVDPRLHIYSLEHDEAVKISELNYSRFEVLENKGIPSANLAVWNESNTGEYDVDILSWKDSDFVSIDNYSDYYHRSVIPYFAQKAKQMPQNSSNWYNLTKSLIKAGAYQDAYAAIELALYANPESPFKEELLAFRKDIMKN